jgi:erythromycin esterase
MLAIEMGSVSELVAQHPPTQAFSEWARDHVHPIAPADENAHDGDLQILTKIIGDANVVAFGEPIHGGHEPLAIRNRLIRYTVKHLGFSAIALETCLSPSKRLYDHVLGRTTETDATLKAAFCYGFGNMPENLELVQWLRTHNAGQPPARQVRIYGVDLTGQYLPYASRSLESVLSFLERADAALGRKVRKQQADLLPAFRSDTYPKLTLAKKNAITGRIQDLIALLRRERVSLTQATSADDYEWALRQAVTATQDDAYLRSFPPEWDPDLLAKSPEKLPPGERWDQNAEMREVALADNLLWVQQRESRRGKVFFFGHNLHVQTGVGILGSPSRPAVGPWRKIRSSGSYLRSALSREMVVIGTYYGQDRGFSRSPVAPPTHIRGVEGVLASLSLPQFIMDMRELPNGSSLAAWFQMPHATGQNPYTVKPREVYDAILFVHTITPSRASRQ